MILLIKVFQFVKCKKNQILKGKIQNTTNDTIVILTTTRSLKTETIASNGKEIIKNNIGVVLKKEETLQNEIYNGIKFKLLSKKQKQIILITDIILTNDVISKITLYLIDEFNNKLIELYNDNHFTTLWFTLISDGLLLLFFCNVLLFNTILPEIYL